MNLLFSFINGRVRVNRIVSSFFLFHYNFFYVIDYEASKETELKKLLDAAEEEMFKLLKKEYPNEDPK